VIGENEAYKLQKSEIRLTPSAKFHFEDGV